ncbi:MAG: hypothetical protein AAGD07_10205 [Planctomycetota bacterium]
MQPELNQRIERHLDTQLGFWSRFLPWREELATHIEEAYLCRSSSTSERSSDSSKLDEARWTQTLREFGDVRQVASQMRRVHIPEYWAWRFLVSSAAAGAVICLIGWSLLFDAMSLLIVAAPAIAFLAFDAFSGSARWQLARNIGIYAALAGSMLSGLTMLIDLENPSHLGRCMAVSLLSGLYGLLL